jgi:hypothetical protein
MVESILIALAAPIGGAMRVLAALALLLWIIRQVVTTEEIVMWEHIGAIVTACALIFNVLIIKHGNAGTGLAR